jgi:hypothetical protein
MHAYKKEVPVSKIPMKAQAVLFVGRRQGEEFGVQRVYTKLNLRLLQDPIELTKPSFPPIDKYDRLWMKVPRAKIFKYS